MHRIDAHPDALTRGLTGRSRWHAPARPSSQRHDSAWPQTPPSFMPTRLHQVTLPALDIEESVSFYSGMGLHLIVSALPRHARLEGPDGGTTVSLHHAERRPESSVAPPAMSGHEVISEDINAEHRRRQGRALPIGGIRQAPSVRCAMFTDPDGNGRAPRQAPAGA